MLFCVHENLIFLVEFSTYKKSSYILNEAENTVNTRSEYKCSRSAHYAHAKQEDV